MRAGLLNGTPTSPEVTAGQVSTSVELTVTATPEPVKANKGLAVLAVIVAKPPATPVTCTMALVPVTVTLGGTVATSVLLESKVTTRPPAGAADERPTVMFCTPPTPTVTFGGD